MYKKFLLSLVCVCSSAACVMGLQDSFNDNSRDRTIWAAPSISAFPENTSASVNYSEQNQRLELTVSDLTTNNVSASGWQDSLTMLSAELNWTVTLDLHNSVGVTESNMVQIGVSLFGHGYGSFEETGLYLRCTANGLELHELWFDWQEAQTNSTLIFPDELEESGSLRFSYTAANQSIEIAYANASNSQYHHLKSVDTSGWSEWVDIKSTGFLLSTFAESNGEAIEVGDVYLDNLRMEYEILDVVVGQMLLETTNSEAHLSIQLEKSEDLVTWTNAGSAIEWVMPVDTDQKFFRVRSAP